MKRVIEELSEAEVLKQYPIRGKANGWHFRLTETSNNAWLAEGMDLWGRRVACHGTEEEALLHECATLARTVTVEIESHESVSNGPAA